VELFLSTFENRIDKKGRLSVPAPFRAVLERRREARVRPVVQGRVLRREAQGRPVVQAVLEVGPRSCLFMLVDLLPVGWLTNRENPISAGSHPSMDSPASLP